MKFYNKDFKDELIIIKRHVKDKKKGKIIVQTKGDEKIYIKATAETGTFTSYHIINGNSEEEHLFKANPYDLDTPLKGKKEEVELKINQKSMTYLPTKENIKIETTDESAVCPYSEFKDFHNPELFLNILKEADVALKKNTDLGTAYVKISSEKAMVVEETQIHFYRLEEDFPFNGGFISKEDVSLLTKSLKGDISYRIEGDQFFIRNRNAVYQFKIVKTAHFPNLRNLKMVKTAFEFEVDVDLMNELLKEFKSKSQEMEVLYKEGELTLDPRFEEYPIQKIQVNSLNGSIKKAVFTTEAFKNLFVAYKGTIKVQHNVFTNVYGKEGYHWRIYTPDKITMIAGSTEPDYELIEQYFREGKISELQS